MPVASTLVLTALEVAQGARNPLPIFRLEGVFCESGGIMALGLRGTIFEPYPPSTTGP